MGPFDADGAIRTQVGRGKGGGAGGEEEREAGWRPRWARDMPSSSSPVFAEITPAPGVRNLPQSTVLPLVHSSATMNGCWLLFLFICFMVETPQKTQMC